MGFLVCTKIIQRPRQRVFLGRCPAAHCQLEFSVLHLAPSLALRYPALLRMELTNCTLMETRKVIWKAFHPHVVFEPLQGPASDSKVRFGALQSAQFFQSSSHRNFTAVKHTTNTPSISQRNPQCRDGRPGHHPFTPMNQCMAIDWLLAVLLDTSYFISHF